ncbi:MAG: type 2 isopentenyl-diphosphate Delta-isomerase [Halobacteria archaeon]
MPGTGDRKEDHVRIVEEEDVESGGTGFRDVRLVHEALPEMDLGEVDTSIDFLGGELDAPIVIESMTGGHPSTKKINRRLASAASEAGVAMGVGSQRAGLEGEDVDSYTVVRDVAPDAFILGNIGAAQLDEYGVAGVEEAVEMVDADALAVHLNFLQEAVQPEGDVDASGCLTALEKICDGLSVPVVVKETGNGFSRKTAERLSSVGVDAIDVAGCGGTTWSGVESYRAREAGDGRGEYLGDLFRNWGIPTTASVAMVSEVHDCVVASGGVRTGVDAAKSIALGADAAGMAKPFLKPAGRGEDEVMDVVKDLLEGLRTCMFVTGSKDIDELSNVKTVILDNTKDYINQV